MNEDNNIHEEGQRIHELSDDIGELFSKQHERVDRLDAVQEDIKELAAELGIPYEAAGAVVKERPSRLALPHDLAAAV